MKTIEMLVDGQLPEAPAVLVTIDPKKIERNLEQMQPIKEFADAEMVRHEGTCFVVASFCDRVIFYHRNQDQNQDWIERLYFLPVTSAGETVWQIIKMDVLVDQYYQMVKDIAAHNQPDLHKLQFRSNKGIVEQ